MIEQVADRFEQFDRNAGNTTAAVVDLSDLDSTYLLFLQRFAYGNGVGTRDVELQEGGVFRSHALGYIVTEAGRYAVDGTIFCNKAINDSAGLVHSLDELGSKLDFCVVTSNGDNLFNGEIVAIQHHYLHMSRIVGGMNHFHFSVLQKNILFINI